MKLLIKVVAFLVVLIVIVGAGVFLYSDVIVKKGIEKGGEIAFGVPTRVGEMNLSLLGGEATMQNLTIANPAGFSSQYFLELGHAGMAVSLQSLLGDKVTIPRVELSGIRVNLEQKDGRNNVNPLLKRARDLAGDKERSPESSPAPRRDDGKKFVISYFSLDNVQVNANLDILGQSSSLNLVLPKIELRNLGEEEQGLTMAELVERVVQIILATAQQSSGQLSPALARLLSGELGDLQALQLNLSGQVRQQTDRLLDDLQQKLPLEVSEEDRRVIDDKAGDLIRDLGGRLRGN